MPNRQTSSNELREKEIKIFMKLKEKFLIKGRTCEKKIKISESCIVPMFLDDSAGFIQNKSSSMTSAEPKAKNGV